MKKIIISLCLLLVLVVTTQAQTNDEKGVANAVESLRKALIDADKMALDQLTATALSYGHSNGKIENKEEFIQQLVSGASDFVTIELQDQTIKIVGNTAIVRHKLIADTKNGGVAGNVRLAVLLVWQKEKKKWKLIARQAVRV